MTIATSAPAERDRAAITETVETIARAAHLHQWDAVRAAFAAEVELDYGLPERLTADAIVARWQTLLSAFDATQHVVHDIAVTVEGDRARSASQFQATHLLCGAGSQAEAR